MRTRFAALFRLLLLAGVLTLASLWLAALSASAASPARPALELPAQAAPTPTALPQTVTPAATSPADDGAMLGVPWWGWLLLVAALAGLTFFVLRGLFGRRPPPARIPSERPTLQVATADPNAPPDWLLALSSLDQLADGPPAIYPEPNLKDTLIIGVGEVGAITLDQIAESLERRFAEYPQARRVRLLYIDVQPITGSQRPASTAYQPIHLSEDQVVVLAPHLQEIDELIQHSQHASFTLGWWKQGKNHADDYGRALGRIAIFYDLLKGTESSALWQKLRQSFEGLNEPAVWIVAATFDQVGAGMVVDLARIARLVRQQEKQPALLLALPASSWGGNDAAEQQARSVATLREIERLMRNADVPFIYNVDARQEALDQWLRSSSVIGQVYLFDAHPPAVARAVDLSQVKPQHGIAALISDCLLALIERSVYDRFQEQTIQVVSQAGMLINTDRISVVGSLGCLSEFVPIDSLRAAIEDRVAHELLFDADVGLVPLGRFDHQANWSQQTIGDVLVPFTAAGGSSADQFIVNFAHVEPQDLPGLEPHKYAQLRADFLRYLVPAINRHLNGPDAGSIFKNRSGGLLRAYAFASALYSRLVRVRQPDIQHCARLVGDLRDSLRVWIETLAGAIDGSTASRPLSDATLASYQQRRATLQGLSSSPVRRPLLDARLDLPSYERIIRDPAAPLNSEARAPLARLLARVGWWCIPPLTNAPDPHWSIKLVIVPGGTPGAPASLPAYADGNSAAAAQRLRALASMFSREMVDANTSGDTVSSALARESAAVLRDQSWPRLRYQSAEASQVVRRVELKGKLFVCASLSPGAETLTRQLTNASPNIAVMEAATSDPFSVRVLQYIYPIPLRTTVGYGSEAWADYYSNPQLHVFPPEQHAIDVEDTRLLRDKRRRLAPDTIQLFVAEDQDLSAVFLRCWVYGLLDISGSEYTLALNDGQEPDPLVRGQASSLDEALTDLVSYRHQSDRLQPFSRVQRANTLARIERAIQQAKAGLGDRAARGTHFDQLRQRRERQAPSNDKTTSEAAKDVNLLLDQVLEHERR